MSEDGPPSSPDESRSRGWSKFRDKFKDKDYKLPFKKHQDRQPSEEVDDFLRSGNPSSALPSERPSIPRINTATEPAPWATRPEDLVDEKWRPSKPTRRPGLHVNFVTANPVVIGEGGDDADGAPVLVSQAKHAAPERPYVSHAHHSSENRAIQRKATTVQHAGKPANSPSLPSPQPELPAQEAILRPKLPNVSAGDFHDQPLTSGVPPLPVRAVPYREFRPRAGTGARPMPVIGKDILQTESEEKAEALEPQRRLENEKAPHKSFSHGPRPPVDNDDDDVMSPSSPSAHKMFEMHAAEGMAHRNSIRGSIHKDISDTLPGLSAHSSVSSLEGPAEAIASLEGIVSAESSRPASSQYSRYSVSPDPFSVNPDGAPMSPSVSASSGHQYLVPPGSSHGTHPVPPQSSSGRLPNVQPRLQQLPSPPAGPTHLANSQGPPAATRPALAAAVPSALPPSTPPAYTGEVHSAANTPLAHPSPVVPVVPPPLPSPPLSRKPEPIYQQQRRRMTTEAEDALTEFAGFANKIGQIFRLSSENITNHPTLHDWQCCALWWFLRARSGLEDFARSTAPRQVGIPDADIPRLRQHHVDMSKAWWIIHDVLHPSPNSYAAGPDAGAVRMTCDALLAGFLSLCASMKKRNILPSLDETLIQGLNTSVWLVEPMINYPSAWDWVLSGSAFASSNQKPPFFRPLESHPLSDAESTFCYGRVFGKAFAAASDNNTTYRHFECVISVTRSMDSPELEAMITSQTSSEIISIRTAEKPGVHWEHARFDHEAHALRIRLPHKMRAWINCSPRDYAWLWSCFDSSQKITRSMRPHSDEILMANMALKSFQYRDSGRPEDFPIERVENCRAALFERFASPEDAMKRKTHRGYRFAIMTTSKLIRNVTFAMGIKAPVEYALASDIPELRLLIQEPDRGRSAHLNFLDFGQRDLFRDLIAGTIMKPTEQTLCTLNLKGVSAGPVVEGAGPSQWTRHNFNSLQLTDEVDPADPNTYFSASDRSEALRITMYSNVGSVVDRLSDASLEVRIRLEAMRPHEIQIMRPAAREDMTIAIGPDSGGGTALRPMFEKVTSGPSALSYEFTSMEDVHVCQQALTGCSILFDGIASIFSITRRRKHVGKDKNWDATNARLQVVEREGRHRVIAFFDGYILADCLALTVKKTDTVEQIANSKTSAPGVKLVDAKFTLPGSNKDDWLKEGAQRDPAAKYCNLSAEEYAAEHEDILIFFESDDERTGFLSALPTPVSSARKFTLMRRI